LTPTPRWSAAMPFAGGPCGGAGGAACDDVASIDAYRRSRLPLPPPCEGPARSESLRVGNCAPERSRDALRPSPCCTGAALAGSKSRRAVPADCPLADGCVSGRPVAGCWAAAWRADADGERCTLAEAASGSGGATDMAPSVVGGSEGSRGCREGRRRGGRAGGDGLRTGKGVALTSGVAGKKCGGHSLPHQGGRGSGRSRGGRVAGRGCSSWRGQRRAVEHGDGGRGALGPRG
jgi:hypothetical protein